MAQLIFGFKILIYNKATKATEQPNLTAFEDNSS